MSGMPDMTQTSAAVASRASKIILKEETICYKNGILHFVFKLSQSSDIGVTKLEFTQTKNGLF